MRIKSRRNSNTFIFFDFEALFYENQALITILLFINKN